MQCGVFFPFLLESVPTSWRLCKITSSKMDWMCENWNLVAEKTTQRHYRWRRLNALFSSSNSMPKTMLYICQAVSQVSSETTSSSSPPPHLRAGSTDTTLRVQEGQVCSITTMSLRVVFVLKIYEKILLNTKQFQLIWLHVVLFLLG